MRRPALARLTGTSGAATLLAVLIALGVLAVPVECARAAGPHSVFVPAADIARLQAGDASAGAADERDAAANADHAGSPAVHADHAPEPVHHASGHVDAHAHAHAHAPGHVHGVAGGHPAPAPVPTSDSVPKAVRADVARYAASKASAEVLPEGASQALPVAVSEPLPQAASRTLPDAAQDTRADQQPSAPAHHADAALASAAALAPARLVLTPPDRDGARLLFAEPAGFPGRPLPGLEAPPP